jgi:16S rRNA (adenine1518-N6/adenine1519-N6)-dimethyltransferase
MQHRPRKRFGQNFLSDPAVIDHIIQIIHPKQDDNFLEIGPGLGALTFNLLNELSSLSAVEVDRDLSAYLIEKSTAPSFKGGTLSLINEDILKIDLKQFGNSLRVVGNLPYNISTPIILHLLSEHSQIKDMCFMLQKEVIDRMAAPPSTKAYGRLSIILQYLCEVRPRFTVPPDAFTPPPKVTSQIVTLSPYQVSPFESTCILNLQDIVRKAFACRRKTLKNNLKGILSAQDFVALDIDPQARPETLSVADYVSLSNATIKQK